MRVQVVGSIPYCTLVMRGWLQRRLCRPWCIQFCSGEGQCCRRRHFLVSVHQPHSKVGGALRHWPQLERWASHLYSNADKHKNMIDFIDPTENLKCHTATMKQWKTRIKSTKYCVDHILSYYKVHRETKYHKSLRKQDVILYFLAFLWLFCLCCEALCNFCLKNDLFMFKFVALFLLYCVSSTM